MRDNNSNRGGNTGGRDRRPISAGRGSDGRTYPYRRDSEDGVYNSSNGRKTRPGSNDKNRGKRPRIGTSQGNRKFNQGNRQKPSISRRKSYSGADYENRAVKRANEKLQGSRMTAHTPIPAEDKEMRLNRFISNSGICSRREADNYISAGLVSVNGKIITELGTKVQPGDDVRFNGERLRGEELSLIHI